MSVSQPSLLFEQTFDDVGACAQAVNWDLDFRQLAPGRLDARVSVIGSEVLEIVRFQFNTPFHQLGSPPRDCLVFAFPDPVTTDVRYYGEEALGGSMLNLNMHNGLDSVSAAGFVGYAVILRRDHLARMCRQLGGTDPTESISHNGSQWHSENTRLIATKLNALYQHADRNTLPLSEFTGLLNDDLPHAIATELGSTEVDLHSGTRANKVRTLKRAMEILNDQDQLPISVAELCSKAAASSSSLNRIFLAEYGVSPKAYIRSRCLSAVRDELSSAPPDSSISDIANRWGFWHMGQFARDFRKLFGELPSERLSA